MSEVVMLVFPSRETMLDATDQIKSLGYATIKHLAIQVLAVGLLMHIVFSAVINICMVTDLLPIVGIPLPLISYGVSNLWITLASLGWLNGISMRRFYIDMHI